MKTIGQDLRVEPLRTEHIESAREVFIKSFCDSEPITKQFSITYEDFSPFTTAFLEHAIREDSGMVIVDKDNKVIACVIAEDIAKTFKPEMKKYPKMRPVFTLLAQLNQPFLAHKKFAKGKVLHMWLAAVEPAYRNHGYYEALSMALIERAIKKGYEFIYSDFTNELSERIVKEFDVRRLCNRIQYQDFILDGKRPLAGLKGAAASYVGALKPDIELDSLENYYTMEEHY